MPVTYRIDKSRGTIHTSCTGAVTLEEVLDHFRMLEEDPGCPARLSVLLDLRDQTSIPTPDQLRHVSRAIKRVRHKVEFVNCAIVTGSNVLFGMLRMFEVFAEDYFGKTHVFRSLKDAHAWLDANRRSRGAAN
jgi:hypothetical protein